MEPYAAVYAYEAAVCAALAGESERCRVLLERVPSLLDSDAGRAKMACWGAERYVSVKARQLQVCIIILARKNILARKQHVGEPRGMGGSVVVLLLI